MTQPPTKRMGRYNTSAGIEGQYQPGSGKRVLANLRNFHSKRRMDQAEYRALFKAQENYLSVISTDTRFTAKLVCAMHRDWLGRLYAWAGRYRTVEMSKGTFHWPPAYLVAQNMATVEKETLEPFTPCRPGDLHRIATDMARVQCELLLVHPFREGNGRLARWVTDLMAMQAGLPAVDYRLSGKGSTARRQLYLRSVIAGYKRDYAPLARFLVDALTRALADRALAPNPRAPSNRLESSADWRNMARRTRGSAR